eukprot:3717701-Pleurochrysis_carterae.AAC.3
MARRAHYFLVHEQLREIFILSEVLARSSCSGSNREPTTPAADRLSTRCVCGGALSVITVAVKCHFA